MGVSVSGSDGGSSSLGASGLGTLGVSVGGGEFGWLGASPAGGAAVGDVSVVDGVPPEQAESPIRLIVTRSDSMAVRERTLC